MPSLDLLLPTLWTPELDVVLRVGSHEGRVEGENQPSWPAGPLLWMQLSIQLASGLTFVELLVHQHAKSFSAELLLSIHALPSLYLCFLYGTNRHDYEHLLSARRNAPLQASRPFLTVLPQRENPGRQQDKGCTAIRSTTSPTALVLLLLLHVLLPQSMMLKVKHKM